MLSNWGPRAAGGQRRNPGIYSAPKSKRTILESGEESSRRPETPKTESSLSSLVSSLVSVPTATCHIDRSFRPASEPDWKYSGKHQDQKYDSGFHSPPTGSRYCSHNTTERLYDGYNMDPMRPLTSYEGYNVDRMRPVTSYEGYNVDRMRPVTSYEGYNLDRMRPVTSSMCTTQYSTQYPRTTGSLRDTQSVWQHSQNDPRLEFLDITTRCPMYPSNAVGTDDMPVYTTPSQDSKILQCSDSESHTESPSTVAPDSHTDSHGNSSDSDAPPVRRGFTSEDSPDGSSDSDIPASTPSDSDHHGSPEVASLEPLSSDDLTSSDEAPITARRMFNLENSQPRHPLAVIGWTGALPSEESSASCVKPSSPDPSSERPDHHDCNARDRAQSAKRLQQALEGELRDLQDEMSSLTQDLMAIKRTIPSRTPEGDLMFSQKC